jgi:hypothetical protein
LVTMFAHRQMREAAGTFRRAAWYHKRPPTFADALALVRKELWAQEERTFCGSPSATDTIKVPTGLHGTANRGGLLCGMMAKVHLEKLSEKSQKIPKCGLTGTSSGTVRSILT